MQRLKSVFYFSDCEKAGSVKAVIQCLDIVFIYLRSLLASKAYLDNPGGDEKTQRQIFQPIDPSASKPFFYRGTSFSAPVDPSCRQVDGHLVSSPKVDKNLLLNDSDSYDIQDVYNFAQSIDGHKILNRRESPHHEEGNEHFSNLMSVQEGFIDSSGSCEVRILFPVVRPLVATPSRKESTRPVPHLPAERNRVSSGSPAAATLMAGFSTILFGEPEPLSKNSVLLGKQAFEPASPIGLPSNYAPAAPMAPRSVSSITSPRPKSAVAEVRKASSYKLDPTTQCTEDAVMGEACVGDQPQTRAVTAPEKRVAFSLDEGSNIDSRNIDEDLLDDSDAMFIYQQLMADFDEHISSTSSKVHSPEVHALGSRRASTNMYKDGRGAFQPTITDISDRNDRKSSNKDGTMKNYILKDNNLQNIRKSSMF